MTFPLSAALLLLIVLPVFVTGELLAIPSEERDAILGTFTITRNVADPTAAAMPKLMWNDDLAAFAGTQLAANNKLGQVCYKFRRSVKYSGSGSQWTDKLLGELVFQVTTGAWLSSRRVDRPSQFVHNRTGLFGLSDLYKTKEYSQIIFDDITHVGCAKKSCGNSRLLGYSCVLSSGYTQNRARTPYKQGEACNGCMTCDTSSNQCVCENMIDQPPCWAQGQKVLNVRTCQCESSDDIDEEGMPIDRTPMEPMAATPEDIIAILDAHNLCRSEAAQGINPASNLTASGMPRLVWNEAMARSAQEYAETCPVGHDSNRHRNEATGLGVGIGQNYAAGFNSYTDAIQAWCSERNRFQYGIGSTSSNPNQKIGHFSGIVTDIKSHVGCGAAICPRNGKMRAVYLCHTNKPGQENPRPWQVGEVCSKCMVCDEDKLCVCDDPQICSSEQHWDPQVCACVDGSKKEGTGHQ